MITFAGSIYNVTSGVEKTFNSISIGQYVGTADMGNWYDQDFTSTSQRFSYNPASNLWRIIEQEAKYYYNENHVWPVLQVYVADRLGFRFEWNHESKNSLIIITNERRVATNFLYFNDQNSWDSGIFSYVWTTAATISDLFDYPGDAYFGWIYFGIPAPEIVSSTPCNGHVTNMHLTVNFDPLWATYIEGVDFLIGETKSKAAGSIPRIWYLNTAQPAWACAMIMWGNNTLRVGPQTLWPATKSGFNGWLKSPDALNKNVYYGTTEYNGKMWGSWRQLSNYGNTPLEDVDYTFSIRQFAYDGQYDRDGSAIRILSDANADYDTDVLHIYKVLTASSEQKEPSSDVDPTDIPPADQDPDPIPPDDPDPYYDPTSDPDNPEYDPTKDPDSPEYDPSTPHTPYRPPSGEGGGNPPVQQPQDPVPVPDIPPAFVTNNSMFTLYNPSAGDLNSLASFLWSPQWSIDTFKKIFANPLDCILGLMVMPHLSAPTSTKEMAVGNIATGVTMRYFTNQFYDFDCGTFKIEEFYASYLDYAPYTKVNIFLPYIGDQQLDTDEVMNKTIGVKYRFDIATGDCVAFITVDGDVLYSYSGNCASRLPLSGNNWSGMLPAFTGALVAAGSMAAGVPALGAGAALAVTSMKQNIAHTGSMAGSPGLMGIQTPYLIITRPRQALPIGQNSFTGYPSFMTESLGSLSGYTEVEACHLEHVPCTAEELEEIERLLKEGVLF